MEVSEPYVVTVKRVLRDLAQTNWFGPYNVVVGVVPKDWLIAYVGAVGVHANFFPGITTYAVLVADTASEVIAPHEIGHVYGLEHVDGYSLSGYDIERDLYINSKVKGHKYYLSALMDEYLASFGPSTVWISKSTYQELQNDLTAAPSRIALRREATLAQVIAVAGEIVQDGGAESATLDSVYVLDNVPIDNSAAGGDYALELQKTDGTILAAVAFSPVFETASDGKAYAPFLAGITYNADTGRVVIKKGATELGVVTRSSGSPTVDITSPSAGDVLSAAATLRWSASDPDGDSLTFTLLFSSDNGSSWDLLAQDLSANDYTLDTTLMTGSDGCHVKVIVNDGFNTAQMLSGRFTVQNAPAVRATIPAADATDVAPGSPLTAIFRDAMDAASIDDSTFTLKDSSGTTLAGTVTYDAATREAVLTPVKPLKAATTFTAGITAAATSQTGLSLGSEYSWSFQTGAAATVPGAVMLSPPNKEIDVPLNTLVCATFDRDMETADMTAELMTLTPDSGSVIVAQVSYDAETATVCLAPDAALEIETTYTVVIAGTVRDSSGIALGADQTWSFTSGSASSPGLRFTDSCSDLATDSDADGLWDELSIEVGVEVLSDANYNLNGRLMDSAGQEIAWATTDNVYLTTGVHLLTLSFDSDGIRSNGSDGPYILADLQFYNAYNIDEYVWLSEACSTYPYSAAGFDAELTLTGLPDITLLPGESRADAFSLNEYAQHKILADDALQYEIEINTDTACGVAIDAEDNVDIYPAAEWLGSSEVTVKVTGGSATARDTFRVTVTETITTTTTIPDSTTTTVPDFYECPPEAPVDCLNGYCCPEDQPYCGSG
ncbi:MAG: Ig-like domain-containing protein, partial [Deltaproteobacteria bacterium]|nr:Ig-like domain-containing protein [Deltaproteobacteria bacterium]